jgi:hypothetical protein
VGLGLFTQTQAAVNPGDYLSYSWKGLAIQPQLDVATVFTDNLFLGRGELRKADLLSTFSPGIRLQYGLDGANQVSLDFMHDETLLLDNSEFNNRQERLDFRLRYQTGPIRLEGRSRLEYLSGFLGGSANQLGRLVTRRAWNDNYTLTYDWTSKTDFYLRGAHQDLDFDRGVALLDISNIEGLLGASYQWTERFRVTAEGFVGQSSVSPNLPGPAGPKSIYYGGFIGARGQFTSKLSGSGRVGYEQRDFSDGVAQAASTPALSFDLTYQAGPKTSVTLRYERRTFPSPQFNNQLAIADAATLQVNQFVGEGNRWMVRLQGRFDNSELSSAPTIFGGQRIDLTRRDRTIAAGLSVLFQPQPWLFAALAYDFETFNMDFEDARAGQLLNVPSYHVNRITFSFNIGF